MLIINGKLVSVGASIQEGFTVSYSQFSRKIQKFLHEWRSIDEIKHQVFHPADLAGAVEGAHDNRGYIALISNLLRTDPGRFDNQRHGARFTRIRHFQQVQVRRFQKHLLYKGHVVLRVFGPAAHRFTLNHHRHRRLDPVVATCPVAVD